MGRKRKAPDDYAKEYPDFVTCTDPLSMVCKYCRITVSLEDGKGATRITEHITSKRHVQLKKPRLDPSGSAQVPHQSSLGGCITRVSRKKDDADDVAHRFCRAPCKAGISLKKTDGPLGELFRNMCPAARTMPSAAMMYRKYLPDVFARDLSAVQEQCKNRPISLTVDETPELRGRPAVAVLVTFFDFELRSPSAPAVQRRCRWSACSRSSGEAWKEFSRCVRPFLRLGVVHA
ncbi:unnamed protein product [Ixodes hexagonus]